VFVELEPGLDALYHRSEMNVGKGKKMKDLYNVGDSLTLEISMIDAENRKMSMKTPSKE
jgi:ribosomal protein S1